MLQDNSPLPGIFITIFVYAFTTFFTIFVLCHYMLYFHMNGRLLDVYNRLTGEVSDFHVPGDMEVSTREIRHVAQKAQRWRGSSGETRAVSVMDYFLTDQDDPNFRETTVEMSIHTCFPNSGTDPGEISNRPSILYRKFYRMPEPDAQHETRHPLPP